MQRPKRSPRHPSMTRLVQQAIITASFLAASTLALAAEIFVRDCGDDAASGLLRSCSAGSDRPKLTIQAAIDAASDGDVIRVYPGVWSGSGNVDLDFQGKKIVVRSDTLDPTDTSIDCSGPTARAVLFDNGETSASVFRGFTVRNGSEFIGAAVRCNAGTSPRIRDCVFESNTTPTGSHGGAIAAVGGSPTVEDCIFEGNSAAGNLGGGAASLIQGAQATFEDCTFDGNHAGNGGTLYLRGGSGVEMIRCAISTESASESGGSIYADEGSTIELVDCEIADCTAVGDGGAISSTESTLIILRCILEDNETEARGGAIANVDGDVSIDASGLHRNSSVTAGGAVATSGGRLDATGSFVQNNESRDGRGGGFRYNFGADGTLSDVTFGSNTCALGGGGLFIEDGDLEVDGCSFTGNSTSSGRGGGLRCRGTATVTATGNWFTSNEADNDGGAIACSDGAILEISGESPFIANVSARRGGAIAVVDLGEARIADARFLDNTAELDGGAAFCSAAGLTLNDSSFESNTATSQRGGGLYAVDAEGQIVVSDCVFDHNTTTGAGPLGSGGGIGVMGCFLRVERCDFVENSAFSAGAGIFGESSDIEVVECTLFSNVAGLTGGGLYSFQGTRTSIEDCTFDSNLVQFKGGGISVDAGPLDLRRTTLVANIADLGGGLATDLARVSVRRCDFRDNEAPHGGAGSLHTGDPKDRVDYSWSRFVGNLSESGPGGGSAVQVDAIFHNCAFFGNDGESGGGIDSWSIDSLTLEVANSAFSGNRADFTGGALRVSHSGVAKTVNCSFSHGVAFLSAGAIWSAVPVHEIANSIFWRNEDPTGITFDAQILVASGSVSYDDSCFDPLACPPAVAVRPIGTNICANPMFVDEDGPDGIYGTDDDDLSLVSPVDNFGRVSPCTDRGNDLAVALDVLDLDGDSNTTEPTPRDLSQSPRFHGRVDIGAYEQSASRRDGSVSRSGSGFPNSRL